ncbi:MAG: hypothetical protein HON14_11800 [Rhodospirillaceae bacterium]|nr:hypothetical protein [Rhodospirillaceae bacterium]MBT4588735.1 hypothetical protein [Rhodospirillaceae bacterium]MBT4939810.1 hypothetical protein [Rhodospirillaceae bacterium]MBT5938625.1 hypothetical protein [Rhodospirillaceae bacterium]MBT7268876.1 hypothetical protein [Rhodospirillaceae bacterium]
MISAVLVVASGIQSASAQTKYNTWSDPSTPATSSGQQATGDLQKFVDDLNKLIGDAERDRAAAPAFLRDLRDLSRRYDVPWRVDLVNETFSDGNFTSNPTWRVTSGRWWVEQNFGLRAAFEKASSQTNSNSNSGQQNNDDLGKQLLGAILNQALGGNQQKSNGGGSTAKTTSQAAIHLDRAITNAFRAQIEFTSWRKEGSFEITTYQGAERKAGYRLFYRAGQATSLELVRTSRYGTNAIQKYTQALNLEDKKTHVLVWSRDRVGNMAIAIDGKKLMTARDQSFGDPFSGLSLINHGGDYIISKVAIKGTN